MKQESLTIGIYVLAQFGKESRMDSAWFGEVDD